MTLTRFAEIAAQNMADFEVVDEGSPAAKMMAERAKERHDAWRKAVIAKVGVRAGAAAMNDPRPEFGLKAVEAWLQRRSSEHLMLRGAVGCGKSTAAAWAVRHWLEPDMKRGTVAWLHPNALVSAVMHEYDPASPRLAEHVVVDDVGTETKADFTDALCQLLDRSGVVVLMTTNMGKADFAKRYDARLIDRLRGSTLAVDIPGGSMRRPVGDF